MWRARIIDSEGESPVKGKTCFSSSDSFPVGTSTASQACKTNATSPPSLKVRPPRKNKKVAEA